MVQDIECFRTCLRIIRFLSFRLCQHNSVSYVYIQMLHRKNYVLKVISAYLMFQNKNKLQLNV